MPVVHVTIRAAADGTISGKAPPGVPPGDCQAQLDVSEQKQPRSQRRRLDPPLHDSGPWPERFTVRREEICDDDGRHGQES